MDRELRVLKVVNSFGAVVSERLQERVKNFSWESSTTTPLSYAWSEWENVPIVVQTVEQES